MTPREWSAHRIRWSIGSRARQLRASNHSARGVLIELGEHSHVWYSAKVRLGDQVFGSALSLLRS